MPTINVSRDIDVPARAVWSIIGNPADLYRWHPMFVTSEVSGGKRECTLPDGARVVEQITAHDDAAMRYAYRITTSPLPLSDYASQLSVEVRGAGSRVTWEGVYTPPEAGAAEIEALLRQVYATGLDALRDSLAT
jgi:hypothetical protein